MTALGKEGSRKGAEAVERVVAQHHLALQVFQGHGSKIAAIVADGAIVAHHEDTTFGDDTVPVAVGPLVQVKFRQGLTVDEDAPESDGHDFFGQADDPFDEPVVWVAGVFEHDDGAARGQERGREAIAPN
ncbi:MAG: hypothetical protein SLRJCFUN_001849 [Candidatus Fervidibacter sp.]